MRPCFSTRPRSSARRTSRPSRGSLGPARLRLMISARASIAAAIAWASVKVLQTARVSAPDARQQAGGHEDLGGDQELGGGQQSEAGSEHPESMPLDQAAAWFLLPSCPPLPAPLLPAAPLPLRCRPGSSGCSPGPAHPLLAQLAAFLQASMGSKAFALQLV